MEIVTCIEYNARQIQKNAPYPIMYYVNQRDGSYRMYGYVAIDEHGSMWARTKKEVLHKWMEANIPY